MAQSARIDGTINNIHGETLPSTQIFLLPDSIGLLTNEAGRFTITTRTGQKEIIFSFVGYETFRLSFSLDRDTVLQIHLKEKLNELGAITIQGKADRQQKVFDANQTSVNILNKDDITSIPVLGGEADLIKTLQLLPGTLRGIEGSSDLFVRGGAADQNLVLLDGAPIYNTSHLFGFLSVFNPDMLDQVEALNGGFPARFGGRLSSILNVTTTSEIPDRTQVSGDVGLIASRFMLEQPVVKNKASFWVAGRRTYIDRVVQMAGEELPYFFYDLNGKVILKPDASNQIELSYYSGEDILDLFRDRNNDGDGFLTTYQSGNQSQAINWKRKLRQNFSSELLVIRSVYEYDIRNIFEDNQLFAFSDIEDYGAKLILTKDSLQRWNGRATAGAEWTRHAISPNVINSQGLFAELLESSSTSKRLANEVSAFSDYSVSPTARLNVTAGFRASMAIVEGRNYFTPEPRFAARYEIRSDQAIKVSYARMAQYIHRISNSAISTPTDIWYPVTEEIRPQTSHQVAVGWQKKLKDTKILISAEGYYKSLEDLVGYEEGTNLFFNTDFASRLIQGKGRAYGFEFLLRKDAGKWTGWLSYTLSWSWRNFDEINGGEWFLSRYDRRHNGAIVSQYAFTKRWAASVVFEFISGSRFTPVVGQYVVFAPTLTGVDLIPVYTGVNSVKLADTHRLDMGIKFRSKPGKKFQWHWFAGVYNVYNRAAPVGISITQDEASGTLKYQQPGLFGLLPFISYGFKL